VRALRRATGIAFAGAFAVLVGARADARGAGASAPRPAPVLDKAKGARAVAAYRKAMNDLCDALWLSPEGKPMRPQLDPNNYDVQRTAAPHTGDKEAAAKLAAIGLDRADDIPLCEKRDPDERPLASGSFLSAGADEVLLETWNGAGSGATRTVALLRADGKGYRLVKHLPIGDRPNSNRFEARLRLTTSSRRDVLFLCESGGLQGIYPTTCGFLGRGSFREQPETPASAPPPPAPASTERDDDLSLVSVTTCGAATSVELSKITPRADRLAVEIAVIEAHRVAAADEGPWTCDKETERHATAFTLEYKFDGTTFHRVTPIPPAVTEALSKN
jgi:hypothetical protein